MDILALDLGKFKTVACLYTVGSDQHLFRTINTQPQTLHDLFVEQQPNHIVIEACSIMGWVADLAQSLGMTIHVCRNGVGYEWHFLKR